MDRERILTKGTNSVYVVKGRSVDPNSCAEHGLRVQKVQSTHLRRRMDFLEISSFLHLAFTRW
jgi:hypothetical protein